MGDTIYNPSDSYSYVATIPKDSLPIMLTSGAKSNKQFKIMINIGNILNRPSASEKRNYTAKKTSSGYSSQAEKTFVESTLNRDREISLERVCTYSTINKITRVEPKKEKFLYRTVSLADINPTNRILGDNWNPNDRVGAYSTLTKVEDKKLKIDSKRASALLKETGNDNYIPKTDNYVNLTNERKGVFTFELTPVTMAAIRNYNSAVREKGGYDNWTLVLVDYRDTNDAATLFSNRYKQQAYACGWHWYSPFLNYLSGDSNASVSIEGCPSSVRFKTDDIRKISGEINRSIVGSKTMTASELRKSRYYLIHKQNVLDHRSYQNAGGR